MAEAKEFLERGPYCTHISPPFPLEGLAFRTSAFMEQGTVSFSVRPINSLLLALSCIASALSFFPNPQRFVSCQISLVTLASTAFLPVSCKFCELLSPVFGCAILGRGETYALILCGFLQAAAEMESLRGQVIELRTQLQHAFQEAATMRQAQESHAARSAEQDQTIAELRSGVEAQQLLDERVRELEEGKARLQTARAEVEERMAEVDKRARDVAEGEARLDRLQVQAAEVERYGII